MQCHFDAKDAEISKLKARIEKLENALGFYADRNNYYMKVWADSSEPKSNEDLQGA